MAFSRNKKINYKSNLQELVKSHFPRLTIDDNGTKMLSNMLNDVNKQLVAYAEKAYKAEAKIFLNTFCQSAKKAIEKVFVGRTVDHALSEAFRQLALLESGCMKYGDYSGPAISSKMPITEKETKEQAYQRRNQKFLSFFKSGVMKFSSQCLSDMSLEKTAGHLLGLRIFSFAMIAAESAAKTHSKKDELQPVDIKNTLSKYLGKDALTSANAEGNKYLVLFANGLFDFKARRVVKSAWTESPVAREKIYASVFKPSMKEMVKRANPNSTTDPLLQKYLGHTLMDLARYLAQNTSEICVKRKAIEMESEDVSRAVSSVFSTQLKLHALLKGSEDVRRYQRGLLIYDRKPDEPKISKKPKILPRSKSQKKRKRSTSVRKGTNAKKPRNARSKSTSSRRKTKNGRPKLGSSRRKPGKINFSPAITDILPFVFNNAHVSLARNLRNDLDMILDDTCGALVSTVISEAGSAELDFKEINTAVLQLFPAALQELAESTGLNAVKSWEDSKTKVSLE